MNKKELSRTLKNITLKCGVDETKKYYENIVFPSNDCPRCIVTDRKIPFDRHKQLGKYYSTAVKNLFFLNKNVKICQEKLKNYVYIQELDDYFNNWKSASRSLTIYGFDEKHKRCIYEKYFLQKTKCCLETCNKNVPYQNVKRKSCCVLHYNQSQKIKSGVTNLKHYIHDCKICDCKFNKENALSKHITQFHNISVETYYNNHLKKDNNEGFCLWCKNPVNFFSIFKGYRKFCYNKDCNVRYYNHHENRAKNSGSKISATIKQNQSSNVYESFWIKKGYTKKQAQKKVKQRQTTNSIESIIKREKCSEQKAIQIRKEITQKWLNSFPRQNYSIISQELFWKIYEIIKNTYKFIYFATNKNGMSDYSGKNCEYKIQTNCSVRSLDFYIKDINKVIEFYGTYWHKQINKKVNYTNLKDLKRESEIKKVLKCKILAIKENDYRKNKEQTLERCLNFIQS